MIDTVCMHIEVKTQLFLAINVVKCKQTWIRSFELWYSILGHRQTQSLNETSEIIFKVGQEILFFIDQERKQRFASCDASATDSRFDEMNYKPC